MDLTWTLYAGKQKVRFIPEAVSYPIEPHNFEFMGKQLRRWSHGFVQNVRLHWRSLLEFGYLRSTVAVGAWDAAPGLTRLPLRPAGPGGARSPVLLLAIVIDAPVILVPVLWQAIGRRRDRPGAGELPGLLRAPDRQRLLHAARALAELVMRRPLLVYEKGH